MTDNQHDHQHSARPVKLSACAVLIMSLTASAWALAADKEQASTEPETATSSAASETSECTDASAPVDDKTPAMGTQPGMGAKPGPGAGMPNSRLGGPGTCATGSTTPGSTPGMPNQQQMRSQNSMRTPGMQQGQTQTPSPDPSQAQTQ